MLVKYQWVNEEIKEEIRKYLKTNESKSTTFQSLWGAAKAVLRGKFTVITGLSQETRKISNKQSNVTPKGTRERRTNKTQS